METNVDWHLVCLVCLQEGIMHSIYEEDDTGIKLNEKIVKCTNVDFSLDANFPEQICSSCLSDLSAAFRFRTNCENSQQILKSLFIDDPNRNINELDEIRRETDERLDSNSILLTPKKRYTKDAEIRTKNIKLEIIPDEDEYEENLQLNSVTEDVDEDIFPNLAEFLKKKAANQAKSNQVSDSIPESYSTKTKTRNKVRPPKRYLDSTEIKRKVGRPKSDTQSTGIIINKNSKSTRKNEKNSSISKKSRVELIEKAEKLVCELCGNTYKHGNALRVHMLRHENVRQFQCELCPKAFVADTDLKRHMRVHTGEKPYACKYCDRRFSDFGSRGKHERTHTGERPYKCQRCNKSFTYSHVLNVHQLVHTGIKKFKCNICDKGFTKKLYLDNHMKNHACEIQYEVHDIKEDINEIKEIKLDEDNIETTYESDLNESIHVQVQESTEHLTIRGQQKSVFTIVKTESGLAEVQYYLPVVE